jgi:membrane protein
VKRRFRDSLAGAIVAVAGLIGLSYLLGIYLRHFDSLEMTYGPLGAAIGLYLWFYLSGFAVLVGGEINFLLAEVRSRRMPEPSIALQAKINNLKAAA